MAYKCNEQSEKVAEEQSQANDNRILPLIIDFFTSFITAVIVITAGVFVTLWFLGWGMYSVDSYSMSPRFPVDSLILVQPVEADTIAVGDVITFVIDDEGTLVTHRVTAIDSTAKTFTTKGDANAEEDSAPVLWGNTVGKVVLCVPRLGSPLRVVTTRANRPYVIGAIVLMLGLVFAWDIVSAKRKKRIAAAKAVMEETAAIETAVTKATVAETAETDTAVTDTAVTDTAVTDTAATDTAATDTAVTDAAVTDTAVTDTAVAQPVVTETAVAAMEIPGEPEVNPDEIHDKLIAALSVEQDDRMGGER